MVDNTLILGVDIGIESLQISGCRNYQDEFLEVYLYPEKKKIWTEEEILSAVQDFLEKNKLEEYRIEKIVISLENEMSDFRALIKEIFMRTGISEQKIFIISRESAFIHYVLNQDETLYEYAALLFEWNEDEMYLYRLQHNRKKEIYRITADKQQITDFLVPEEGKDKERLLDEHFASIARQILSREVVSAVFLTGKGFEGGWLNKSLNVLCDGRRAFIGQNLFSSGCCYYGKNEETKDREEDLVICAPETVLYDAGLLDTRGTMVEITKAGGAWYETKGEIELIPERIDKIDVVFSNSITKEKQIESVDISELAPRPKKTGRLRLTIRFLNASEGLIFVKDLGFGMFVPGTHQVFMKEFKLL